MAGGIETKPCTQCGAAFAKPGYPTPISAKRWHAMRYCSPSCAAAARKGPAQVERPISAINTGHSAFDQERKAIVRATDSLLKACIRYGLRHGLPNHTAEMVREKAAALGVAA